MPDFGYEATIVPELRVFERDIDAFEQYPGNPRRHRLDKIQASLQLHGQRSPIVVQRSTGFIVKGNGTWAAAKKLGWLTIAALILDIPDENAAAYLADDNLTSDLSSNDPAALAAHLGKLGPEAQGSIWSMDEIADVVESVNGLVDLADQVDAAFLGDRPGEADAEAARQTGTGAVRKKEAPLAFTLEDHAQFMEHVKYLGKRWSLKSTAHVCLEALRRCAFAEQAGGEAAGVLPLVGRAPEGPVPGQVEMTAVIDSTDERAAPPAVAPLKASVLARPGDPWVLMGKDMTLGSERHLLSRLDGRLALCGKSTRDGEWVTNPEFSVLPLCSGCEAASAEATSAVPSAAPVADATPVAT